MVYPREKQIVFIPYWVQETLQRNQLPLADCLNLAKIQPLMSLNDVVAFYTLQDYYERVMGIQAFAPTGLFWSWINGIPEGESVLRSFYNSVSTLSCDKTFKQEVESRLFHEDAKTQFYTKPFITYDLTPEVCGVVIYPGYFVGNNLFELQRSVVEAILKVLYVYDPSHEVAKTPLFKKYLELLSVVQQ